MNKINFENAPSTNTPLSAENLNQMQVNMEEVGAVVSATEPTTNEKVWFKKGNNLFNPSNVVSGYASDRDGSIKGRGVSTSHIEIEGNQNYYILSNKTSGNWGAWYDSDKNFISGITLSDNIDGIVSAPSNAKYVVFTVSYEDNNPNYATNVMIAQSSVTIPYEPYVEKAIYTRNTNGIYEEFYSEEKLQKYSTAEHRIGTWINGKPLYQKILIISGKGTESIYYPAGVENLEFMRINYGISYSTYDNSVSFPICRSRDSDELEATVGAGWINIVNVAGKDYTGWTFVVVVEYTKTTD